MSTTKPKSKSKSKANANAKPKTASKPRSSVRSAATGAARSAAKGAAKGAARGAAKGAARGASKTVAAGGDKIGRGTRWTEDQVRMLLDAVRASETAKAAFEQVARELDKSAGTVAQKYYNLQKATAAPAKRSAAPASKPASGSSRAAASIDSTGTLPTATELRTLTVDDLVGLAARVKAEIDRRRAALDEGARQLAG